MKLKTLLRVNAGVSLFYGLGLLLVPAPLLALYGAQLEPVALMLARLLGAVTLSISLVAWLARHAERADPTFLALATAIAIGDAIGTVVVVQAVLDGTVNALGWTTVAVCAGFTAGYGHFAFRRPAPIPARFT